MKQFYQKHVKTIAVTATAAVFLALIRTLFEPFRLHYYSNINPDFLTLRLFLAGAIIAAVSLFVIALLSFYKKYSAISITAALTIAVLLMVKITFAM